MKKIHTFINTCLRRILKFAGQTSSVISTTAATNETAAYRRWHLLKTLKMDCTPSASLHPASQSKPSAGILKGKGREADEETPGAVTWRQTWQKMATHGEIWNNWPRTVMAGGWWLAAYVPEGVAGDDGHDEDSQMMVVCSVLVQIASWFSYLLSIKYVCVMFSSRKPSR